MLCIIIQPQKHNAQAPKQQHSKPPHYHHTRIFPCCIYIYIYIYIYIFLSVVYSSKTQNPTNAQKAVVNTSRVVDTKRRAAANHCSRATTYSYLPAATASAAVSSSPDSMNATSFLREPVENPPTCTRSCASRTVIGHWAGRREYRGRSWRRLSSFSWRCARQGESWQTCPHRAPPACRARRITSRWRACRHA